MSVVRNSVRAAIAAATIAPTSGAPARAADPVQVRTSALAILAASLVPATAYAIAVVPLVATLFDTWPQADWSTQVLKLAISSALFVINVLAALLPFTLVIGITHMLARSLQRRRDLDYAAIGAIVSLVTAPMMNSYLPAAIPLPTLVLAGALAGAACRRLSGMLRLPFAAARLAGHPNRDSQTVSI